jgi:hypothetical protein
MGNKPGGWQGSINASRDMQCRILLGRHPRKSNQPGPIDSIICHMIEIARPIHPPEQPRTPAELRSQPLALSDAEIGRINLGCLKAPGVLTSAERYCDDE